MNAFVSCLGIAGYFLEKAREACSLKEWVGGLSKKRHVGRVLEENLKWEKWDLLPGCSLHFESITGCLLQVFLTAIGSERGRWCRLIVLKYASYLTISLRPVMGKFGVGSLAFC